jgi:hypothetical protein
MSRPFTVHGTKFCLGAFVFLRDRDRPVNLLLLRKHILSVNNAKGNESEPVSMINHYRSDISIVLHNSVPFLLFTVREFYARAIELKESLLEAWSKYSLESRRDSCSTNARQGRPVIENLC